MYIPISQDSDIPIYQQIVDAIKDAVLSEELKEGEAMPSIRSLAKELGISAITSKRAYEELEKMGYIVTIRKKGSFIRGVNKAKLLDARRKIIQGKIQEAVQMAKRTQMEYGELEKMLKKSFTDEREE
ncbi:GntR family transcriptional regulator [Clostridia bacterium]|nr:GntR family transcriptional regulator [Clostridia bacterium]